MDVALISIIHTEGTLRLWTFVCVRGDLNSKSQYQKLFTMNMSDPTSQSNYNMVTSDHVEFKWTLDFCRRIIQGVATHRLIIKEDNVNEVVFVLILHPVLGFPSDLHHSDSIRTIC